MNNDLTAHEKLIKARIGLFQKSPFFSYLALFLKFAEDKNNLLQGNGIGVNARGDVLYNPKWIDGLSNEAIQGIICHELLHLSFLHISRFGNRNKDLWNVAIDLAVNTILEANKFQLPKGEGIRKEAYSDTFIFGKLRIDDVSKKSAEMLYEEFKVLLQEQPQGQQQQGQGQQNEQGKQGKGKGDGKQNEKGFDSHMKEQGQQTPQEQQEQENEWKSRVEEAVVFAKQKGELPQGMERWIKEIRESHVDWRTLLRKYITSYIPVDLTYCLDKNTKIMTSKGFVKISNVRQGRCVIGYKNGKFQFSKVKSKITSRIKEKYEIITDKNKKIICSGEHRLLTERGYVRAKNLKINDVVLTAGEKNVKRNWK